MPITTKSLPLEKKYKAMLADVVEELQQYKDKEDMLWWVMRLEEKRIDLEHEMKVRGIK